MKRINYKPSKRLGEHSEGNFAEVTVFEFMEFGKPTRWVERQEKGGVQGSPYSRFHCSHILNELHHAMPDLFPPTVEARNLRFDEKIPVMQSPEIVREEPPMDSDKLIGKYKLNLVKAGFVHEADGPDIAFIREGDRVMPFFFEISGLEYPRLTGLMDQLKKHGRKEVDKVRPRIERIKNAWLDSLIKDGMNHENQDIQHMSILDIGRIGDVRGYDPLKEKLLSSSDKFLMGVCAYSMTKLDMNRSLEFFGTDGLYNSNVGIAEASVNGLQQAREKEHIERALEHINAADARITDGPLRGKLDVVKRSLTTDLAIAPGKDAKTKGGVQ